MANEYMRDALDQTETYLTAQMEATLDAIETARSLAEDTIPRWKVLAVGFDFSRQYPMLSIVPSVSESEYGEGESPFSEEHWNYHTVDIMISEAGQVQATVQNTLLYYIEAIERIVNASYTFGGIFNRVRLAGTDYAVMIQAQEDKRILQTAVQSLEIRQFNDA